MNGLQAIGVLIIRIWAFTMLYPSLSFFVQSLWTAKALSQDSVLAISLVETGIWFAISLSAWFLAPTIARRVIPDRDKDTVTLVVGEKELVAIGSFLIGGFFLVSKLPYFLSESLFFVNQLLIQAQAPIGSRGALPWRGLAVETVVLAIVTFLTFRPREVANMFAALRVAGLSKTDED